MKRCWCAGTACSGDTMIAGGNSSNGVKINDMAWIYLLIAAVFEVAWTFSLKFMRVADLRTIRMQALFHREGWMILAPFLGYIVFGVGNIVCVSLAMRQIPAATALAVWMGLTLLGVKMVEILGCKEPYDGWQFLYMGLILAGIIGLKRGG